jgi:hypothetical protein
MTYRPKCANCGRKIKADIPEGVTGIFFCSMYCHNYWKLIKLLKRS